LAFDRILLGLRVRISVLIDFGVLTAGAGLVDLGLASASFSAALTARVSPPEMSPPPTVTGSWRDRFLPGLRLGLVVNVGALHSAESPMGLLAPG
jgi:hypothetical protein